MLEPDEDTDCDEGRGMRIVDRKAFLAMPAGTVYATFSDRCRDGDICIKQDLCGDNDWFYTSFSLGDTLDVEDSDGLHSAIDAMADKGISVSASFEFVVRDGCFEDDILFIIYEKKE